MPETNLSRRQLLAAGLTVASVGSLASLAMSQVKKRPPALPAELVQDFVRAGHGDLNKTKAMLEAEPGLLNATWDWGGGDFESALEGAGHMGRRDIAEFLISKGSRANIFCVAMLGQLELVKAMLDANPGLKQAKGPHGISLATHATKGGEAAKPVLDYLAGLGLSA